MIPAALYCRSSKDRSDVSIDAQRRALEELALQRGFSVVAVYEDAVESGKDDQRPGFQNLLRDLRSSGRKWEAVLALDTARVARRRALAILFEEDCRKRGVKILYNSLPDSDPITEMLLKSVLQAMDEWHSLTSKAKGLAGMAENVRQGWRAGGRAPRGYRLVEHATGAIRDGEPVTKSRLATADDALQIRAFLQARARGVPRLQALGASGLGEVAVTSLIEIERNALTYAGHTVWNRHSEKVRGGYLGAQKWRPREEWVIQRDTHEALISQDEADQILAGLEGRKRKAPHGGARPTYLMSGLLFAPDGTRWVGDGGDYRLGKGRRIRSENVDKAIVAQVMSDISNPAMCESIAARYRNLAKADVSDKQRDQLARRAETLERKIGKLADLISETTAPAALLRQIEASEAERDSVLAELAEAADQAKHARALRDISAQDVARTLAGIAEEMGSETVEALHDRLRSVLQQVILDPDSGEMRLRYRVGEAESGVLVASPRRGEQFPAYEWEGRGRVRINRPRAKALKIAGSDA